MPSAEKPTIPQQVTDLVARFDRNRDAYKSGNYNETQVRREFVDPAKCASPTSKRRSVVASMPSKQFDPSTPQPISPRCKKARSREAGKQSSKKATLTTFDFLAASAAKNSLVWLMFTVHETLPLTCAFRSRFP